LPRASRNSSVAPGRTWTHAAAGTVSVRSTIAPIGPGATVIAAGVATRPNSSRQGFQRTTRGPSRSIVVRSLGPGRSTAMRSAAPRAAATARAVVAIRSQAASSSCAALMRSTSMPAASTRSTHAASTSAAVGAVTIT
jgi:hypothetical protein